MTELERLASTAVLGLALLQCAKQDDAGEMGIDESFLDRSADPCSDFYQFACGTWINEHPVDKYPGYHYLEGSGRDSILLQKIVSTDRDGMPYVADRDSELLGNYYDSCLRGRAAPAVSHTPLDALLTSITSATTLGDIATAVASLHAQGIVAFFWLGAEVDPGDPSRRVPALHTGGWNLDSTYFVDDPRSVLSQYEDHINRTAALYGVAIDAKQVLAIDAALAGAGLSREARADPNAVYHLTSLATLTAAATQFPWTQYLASSGFPAIAEVNVTDPGYFSKLDELLGSQPIDTLKTYLTWQVLESYAFALGQPFVVEEAKFHFGVLYGNPSPGSDTGACLGSTASIYGFSLSRPFVSVVFDETKRTASLKILSSLREALRREIDSRPWIDAATRSEAQQKLDKIDAKVGYPDIWPDPLVSLDRSTSYLQWWLAVRQASRAKNIASLGAAVDRTAWRDAPLVTNAFYSGTFNEIVFPAAILQSPQFVVERASAVNYGAIGSIMGHELTHGFDDDGRLFDGDGKLRNWWTPDVGAEFVSRAGCLADQYSHYEPLAGQTIDGHLTLGENIADLGGARLAYAAYQSSGVHESFAGSFDADQQFFLAFAQLRCSHGSDTEISSLLRSDPHSPDKFRVNGVVTNLPEFAAAFKCPAGSPMAPADRCEVW